ncbi:MAG: RNA polymerase sigma factor FliA [Gammaproteobacteria bacterium]|nr:RNA polymerase sigma factor FliA [Gammaproteobacteria bacterium]MDH5730233.1 RNA polymerase sigma factor FliA [Gammaproteobacteria bacterium]
MNGIATYDDSVKDKKDQELVVQYAPLVKRIAYHLISRLPPSVLPDDLIQAGMIGLLEAARNYDSTQGASFETYAGIRIRGAMLDEIRRSDWAPRSVHKKARMVAEAVRFIENQTGRDARDHEVADALGIPLDEYHQMLMVASGYRVTSFEEITPGDEAFVDTFLEDSSSPLDGLQKEDFKRCLAEAISSLPERERLVMALYYDEELNLREIGEVLGVSESRVCQIHSQAVIRLQARMAYWRKP